MRFVKISLILQEFPFWFSDFFLKAVNAILQNQRML